MHCALRAINNIGKGMYILKNHKSIIVIATILIMSILSDIYTYYCVPLKVLHNVPAKVVVENSVRGVRYILEMYLYIDKDDPLRISINKGGTMADALENINEDYLNKNILVDFYYKLNPCHYCYLLSFEMPILIKNDDFIFLDYDKSRYIFVNEVYRIAGLLFSMIFIYSFCFYLSLKFPSNPKKD